jgi:hypothetical protein
VYARYPGTNGITHGDAKEIRPAISETAIAIKIPPSKT